ncbi:MAG: hypothetical protein BWZ02_01323 [Lentisphaerae bacterium ADurb.BinA184]|nr:MAG: hypothetical protein BWZ02_01323 [Lentisphaerae bacterium ADurb.BinA184]
MRGLRKTKADSALPQGMAYRNPFDAVPLVAPGVSIRAGGEAGSAFLRAELDTPDTRRGRFLRRLHMQRAAHIKLDPQGTVFWRLIDGRRDLGEIACAIARELGLAEKDAREATIRFTRDLMLRNYIMLKISPPPEALPAGVATPRPHP